MNEAAGRGDGETVVELARCIRDQIELEQQRRREDEEWEYGVNDDGDEDA